MNNSQVAHIWAQQKKQAGKGSNFFFEGDTIYSHGYHYKAAKFHGGVVLINSDQYSNSTARHLSIIRSAVSHLTSFEVPDVDPMNKPEHRANYNYIRIQIDILKRAFVRARSNKEYYRRELIAEIRKANEYTKIFKLGYRQIPETINDEKIKKQTAAQIARERKAARKKAAARRAEQAEHLKEWQRNERRYINLPYSAKQYLRIKQGSPDTIETSNGAEFPLEHATRAYPLIKRIIKSGKDWQSNGHTIKIGHFQIDSIVNQVITAGCHKINFKEILRLAIELGIETGREVFAANKKEVLAAIQEAVNTGEPTTIKHTRSSFSFTYNPDTDDKETKKLINKIKRSPAKMWR